MQYPTTFVKTNKADDTEAPWQLKAKGTASIPKLLKTFKCEKLPPNVKLGEIDKTFYHIL